MAKLLDTAFYLYWAGDMEYATFSAVLALWFKPSTH